MFTTTTTTEKEKKKAPRAKRHKSIFCVHISVSSATYCVCVFAVLLVDHWEALQITQCVWIFVGKLIWTSSTADIAVFDRVTP